MFAPLIFNRNPPSNYTVAHVAFVQVALEDVQLTPAIRAKAAEFGTHPVQIYNWVRNTIEYTDRRWNPFLLRRTGMRGKA